MIKWSISKNAKSAKFEGTLLACSFMWKWRSAIILYFYKLKIMIINIISDELNSSHLDSRSLSPLNISIKLILSNWYYQIDSINRFKNTTSWAYFSEIPVYTINEQLNSYVKCNPEYCILVRWSKCDWILAHFNEFLKFCFLCVSPKDAQSRGSPWIFSENSLLRYS